MGWRRGGGLVGVAVDISGRGSEYCLDVYGILTLGGGRYWWRAGVEEGKGARVSMRTRLDREGLAVLGTVVRGCLRANRPIKSQALSGCASLGLDSTAVEGRVTSLRSLNCVFRPRASTKEVPSSGKCHFCMSLLVRGGRRRVDEQRSTLLRGASGIRGMLRRTTGILTSGAGCTAVISTPIGDEGALGFVRLSRISRRRVMTIVMLNNGIVGGGVVRIKRALDGRGLLGLGVLLGAALGKLSVSRVALNLVTELGRRTNVRDRIINRILSTITRVVRISGSVRVCADNTAGVFGCPRLDSGRDTRRVVDTFRRGRRLTSLIARALTDRRGGNVRICVKSRAPIGAVGSYDIIATACRLKRNVGKAVKVVNPGEVSCRRIVGALGALRYRLSTVCGGRPGR